MMNRFLLILLFTLTGLVSNAQDGQYKVLGGEKSFLSPQKYTIASCSVTGVDYLDVNAIRLISGLTIGKEITVPGQDISTAINSLWEQELFSDVQIFALKTVGDEIFLQIDLKGRPKLNGFNFFDEDGELIRKGEADKLREEINLQSGNTITESLVKNTENIVRGYYAEKGFYKASVNIVQVYDTTAFNARKFNINIDKGQRIKIKEINIEGNEIDSFDEDVKIFNKYKTIISTSDGGIRRSMKDTKRKGILRVFKRSKFNRTAYERDKAAIIEKYNAFGLRDANIYSDSVYFIDDKHMVIDIKIEQGDKYYFGDITWVGNSKYTSGALDTLMGIEKGEIYNKALLDQRLFMSQDGRDITSLYMDRGHLFFSVRPIEMSIDEENHINFEMRISEGKEARIRNVIIKGNNKTNDHVILREIRTQPGDLFNRNDIIRTQRELANLGYFDAEQFGVNPIPNPADGTVDIEYTLVEKSSDQIELSGGFGGGRLIGTLGLSFTNFSTKNFFKKDAWDPLPAGDGQRLSLRGQTYGRGYQSYNLSFTEPWLGGKKPTSLSIFSSYSLITNELEKTDVSYSQTSITSIGVGLGSRLKWPDDYFQIYGEINYQYYDLYQSQYFEFTDGYSNNISVKGILTRSSVDQPIYPRSGSKFALTAKATLPYSAFDGYSNDQYAGLSDQELNKYAEYYKIKFTGEWYAPLSKNKKLIFNPKFGFGFMGAYNKHKGVSSFERFYLGGSGLNGTWQFDGREIIPLRGYSGTTPVSAETGGTVIAKYSMELRYPLSLNPSATIYGLMFAEAGNTWNKFSSFDPFNVKRSAGFGVRVFLPMFGMLGVDFAWGFDPLDVGSAGKGIADSDPGANAKGFTFGFFPIIGMNIGDL
ncbi:BamA/OMP85 family outer membrane protein [Crocinitomix catalasitica]|uniref:BamA/OMP85 family outer membrane protein n=1 Tax=Crocinitomix catalasitica TaxID=184607 RepID=UPI000687AD3F|nr:POTRA domain-containing protein [Crocinitomix catalasitica]